MRPRARIKRPIDFDSRAPPLAGALPWPLGQPIVAFSIRIDWHPLPLLCVRGASAAARHPGPLGPLRIRVTGPRSRAPARGRRGWPILTEGLRPAGVAVPWQGWPPRVLSNGQHGCTRLLAPGLRLAPPVHESSWPVQAGWRSVGVRFATSERGPAATALPVRSDTRWLHWGLLCPQRVPGEGPSCYWLGVHNGYLEKVHNGYLEKGLAAKCAV